MVISIIGCVMYLLVIPGESDGQVFRLWMLDRFDDKTPASFQGFPSQYFDLSLDSVKTGRGEGRTMLVGFRRCRKQRIFRNYIGATAD